MNQTFADFEFLIIDDCSTDGTYEFLQTVTDSRIKIIRKSKNSGLTVSLNMGLELAKGKYIARMDGDDISEQNRFKKQVEFMEANEDVVVCGSWFQIIDSNEIIKHPVIHEEIKVALLSFCSIAHPTVIMRNNFLKSNMLKYDIAKESAEDYDLWARICGLGKLYNIPEVLLFYRAHPTQVSSVRKVSQLEISKKIQSNFISPLLSDPKRTSFLFESRQKNDEKDVFIEGLMERLNIISKLRDQNIFLKLFDEKFFNEFLNNSSKKEVVLFLNDYRTHNFENLRKVFLKASILFKFINPNIILKYIIKCMIRFKYFVQKNSGVSRARNFGVKNTLAKYLFFLDGDDKISKKCIESYIKGFGTSENIILVYSDPYCIGERSGKVNFQPFSYQELLYENMIVVSALIIKQIFVEAGGFDEEFSEGFEDWEFWLRYLKPNSKVIKLQGEFFYYRIIGSSRNNSMSTIKMQDIHWKIFFKYSYFYKQYFSDPLTLLRANKSLNKNYKLSLDYKIGHGILFVFRLIKNIIYRVPNTFKKRK